MMDLVANKDPADKDGPLPYIPGTIKKIRLQNFMCHELFELELGSRVNFIIGPNGSGKSALLTAIVVVLGGRATTTSRGRRNSEFVQYGKHTAKITIEIHNYDKIMDKDKAYKPDEYGKKIIVEKIIPRDPEQSAKLIIRNDKEKRISERKSELDDILEFFKIQTNNPICILNQEVSKSFLHSKKPEDKFELFMKATSLEQIESDLNEATMAYKDWGDYNTRKKLEFKLLDNEYHKCHEKSNFLLNRVKLQEDEHKLNIEYMCGLLRDQETKANEINNKIAEKREQADRGDVEISKHQEKIQSAELRIEQHGVRTQSCRDEVKDAANKKSKLSEKERNIEMKRIEVAHLVEKEQYKLARLERDKTNLLKSIEDFKNAQTCRDSVMETEKRKLEIEQLKREKPEFEAREKSLRQRTNQLRHSMTETHQDVARAMQRVNNIKNEISQHKANLASLRASQGEDLRKYGIHFEKIIKEIDRDFAQGKFKKKPFGPIGRYIKLKTPEVSPALEIHLGAFARGFTCDNHSDMLALHEIFSRVKAGDTHFREPMVFNRQYRDRFDADRYKAVHETYLTLVDHIEVSEAAVFNALLDRSCLEQALFIPDYNEAQNIMITPNMIPKGTRVAYTADRHIMYPRTKDGGFRSIADDRNLNYYFSKCNQDQIIQKEREIERLNEELRRAEAEYVRLSDSEKVQRSEYDASTRECEKIMSRLRQIENQLLELQTIVADIQHQELSAFEDELERCLAQIHDTQKRFESEKFNLESVKAEKAEIANEKESAVKVYKLKEEELTKLETDIQNERDLIKRHRESIQQIDLSRKKASSDIAELTKKLDHIIQVEITSSNASLRDFERPTNVRSTEAVRIELKKVQAALNVEIENNQDPDELISQLRKRMEEIKQMQELKSHNQKNHELTSKSVKDREEGTKILKNHVCASVGTTFSSVMNVMEMVGTLNVYYHDKFEDGKLVAKGRTLEMSVDTSKSNQRVEALSMSDNNVAGDQIPTRRSIRTQPDSGDGPSRSKRARANNMSPSEKENNRMTDTRSLSGGERSFSTVAFVLALWHHCHSPFKLMDEIDVFMDMVTRRMSYNALIKFAKTTKASGQFIYFSPLELPEIDNSENLVRVFEMPRIIRRGVQSLPPNFPSIQED